MLLTTTQSIQGRAIQEYLGIVTGEVIIGANFFRDIFAWFIDIFGGRAAAYEEALREAREEAFDQLEAEAQHLGADAVVGIDIDYEVIAKHGSMLMVSVSGTAVRL